MRILVGEECNTTGGQVCSGKMGLGILGLEGKKCAIGEWDGIMGIWSILHFAFCPIVRHKTIRHPFGGHLLISGKRFLIWLKFLNFRFKKSVIINLAIMKY